MKTLENITLKQIASILEITEFKGKKICGLDYFYIEDKNIICAYYNNNDLRYTYDNPKAFIDDHGIEDINELN